MQEDTAHADQWKATFEKTVAAYQRNLSQHKTGLVADFYKYDEHYNVYDASTEQVLEMTKTTTQTLQGGGSASVLIWGVIFDSTTPESYFTEMP